VFAGVVLLYVSGTTVTAPGTVASSRRASSSVGTVRLPARSPPPGKPVGVTAAGALGVATGAAFFGGAFFGGTCGSTTILGSSPVGAPCARACVHMAARANTLKREENAICMRMRRGRNLQWATEFIGIGPVWPLRLHACAEADRKAGSAPNTRGGDY
jgi:hypothetical protein